MMFTNKSSPSFYDMLEAQARVAHESAKALDSAVLDFGKVQDYLAQLDALEHEGDRLTHAFINKVNTLFITPMDKEDLHGLSDRLDDITDTIERAGGRIGVYRLAAPRAELSGLVTMLMGITNETHRLVALLRNGVQHPELEGVIAGIHAMESRTDKAFRQALAYLFDDDSIDIRLLIQWKEIYELIESAVNRCEKFASFVESLMVKYA
ncbi:MAG TPA: DUF47 family protein [Chthonomonadaceae bacterium]|nr:DUF47 family protein [Chthonomonadaceae bacterium]